MAAFLHEIVSQAVSLKGLRGLTAEYVLLPSQFAVVARVQALMDQGERLKPGEETLIQRRHTLTDGDH
jgi:hypothetical protein